MLDNQGGIGNLAGSTINLTNQPNGITDAVGGFFIEGAFNAGPNNAFRNLQSIEGQVELGNAQLTNIFPGNGTLAISNTGLFYPEGGTSAQINGHLDNAGWLSTNFDDYARYVSPAPNTLTITGTLTNASGATFFVGEYNDTTDVANVGALVNYGSVTVGTGATLNLTNQPAGITDVVAGSTFDIAGTFKTGANNGFYQLTNVEGNLVLENAQTTTTTPIGGTFTVASTGFVEVKSGTKFDINGNVVVNSGGIFSVNDPLPTTVNITGMLTNLGGQVNVVGPTAFLNVGGIGNGGTLTLPEGSTVNLANGFYQLAKGTLGETIGASGFSILAVNGGLVILDGSLDVLLDPGFYAAVGSTYEFLTFNPGMLSGAFASIQNRIFNNGTEYWVLDYNNANGYVSLEAQLVPEPSSFLLLGAGLLGVACGVRRRLMR